jgi:hypothetical protein
MIEHLSRIAIVAAFVAALCLPGPAAADKAPCVAFQKQSDGKWNVLKAVKIEHGKASVMLNPGTKISPGTQVTGVDLYPLLEKSCQQGNSNNTTGGR